MRIILLVFLFVFGAVFGSFICCQVRRMRAKETGKKIDDKRSVCMNCGRKLEWYDNIPILSWVMLGGKCRKCKSKIGALEIISEVGLAVVFLLIGIFCLGDAFSYGIFEIIRTIILFIFVCLVWFLALYDGMWGELPTGVLYAAIGVGLVFGGSGMIGAENVWGSIMSMVMGVGILGGVYFLIYVFSREKLVGGGDWLLGVAIGLALGNWWLSLVVLFLSNFFAAAVMIPMMKKIKGVKIFFGPWMVGAYLAVMIFSEYLLGVELFVNFF